MLNINKNKISEYIVVFNLVLVPLVFLPNQSLFDYFYFPKYVMLMISCLLLIIPVWINRNNLSRILTWDITNQLLLAYFVYLVISVFFAVDPIQAINGSKYRLEGLSTIVFYFMLFLAARSVGELDENVYKAVVWSAFIVSVYGIIQYYGVDFFQREAFRGPNTPISTIGNQNFIGSYMVLVLPLTIHFWLSDHSKNSLIAYSVILFGLFTTMSRGPWIGFLVSLVSYVVLDHVVNSKPLRSKSNFVLLGTTILVTVAFSIISDASLLTRIQSIFHDVVEVIDNSPNAFNTGSGRWFIWQKTLILIGDRPLFGYGIENLGEVFVKRFPNEMIKNFGAVLMVDKAHNEYLDQMVSSGIPSLMIYLAFIGSVLKAGVAKLKNSPMRIALLAAIIGYLVQAFFNIRVVTVSYIFWIYLGLVLGSSKK